MSKCIIYHTGNPVSGLKFGQNSGSGSKYNVFGILYPQYWLPSYLSKTWLCTVQVCCQAVPQGAVPHCGAPGQLPHDARQEHWQEAHDRQVGKLVRLRGCRNWVHFRFRQMFKTCRKFKLNFAVFSACCFFYLEKI